MLWIGEKLWAGEKSWFWQKLSYHPSTEEPASSISGSISVKD
jgi:hypothetical protein